MKMKTMMMMIFDRDDIEKKMMNVISAGVRFWVSSSFVRGAKMVDLIEAEEKQSNLQRALRRRRGTIDDPE